MNPVRFLPIFPVLFAAAALQAQPIGDHIKGLERGAVVRLDSISTTSCNVLHNCVLPAPMDAHAVPLGGTTFDSIRGAEYSSDGGEIVLTDIACGRKCSVPIAAAFGRITGMANNKFRRHLYTGHTDNLIRIWDTRPDPGCPTSPLGQCRVNVQNPGEVVTGLEFDNRVTATFPNGRLFVVTNLNNLFVLQQPDPVAGVCAEICRRPLPGQCTNYGRSQGLTYNPARRLLYATDGKLLLTVREASDCTLIYQNCCTVGGLQSELSGLGWYSGVVGPLVGVACGDIRCLGCRPDVGALGIPSVMNPSFQVTLNGLPNQSSTVLVLALGPALTPGLPWACGNVHVNPAPLWLSFPVAATPGTSSCSARGSVPMGIFPPITVGLEFVVQSASVCQTPAGLGFALSAGLPFTIGA
jgi:hypothetical protein